MCKTSLEAAGLPIRRPKMWNKWIGFTALISWIISRVRTKFKLAYYTKSTDLFRNTKFIPSANTHTHITLRAISLPFSKKREVDRPTPVPTGSVTDTPRVIQACIEIKGETKVLPSALPLQPCSCGSHGWHRNRESTVSPPSSPD